MSEDFVTIKIEYDAVVNQKRATVYAGYSLATTTWGDKIEIYRNKVSVSMGKELVAILRATTPECITVDGHVGAIPEVEVTNG